MAHRAYVVLNFYASSSSDKVYEVRRGGDGVLYCTCRGWVASKDRPRKCTHTKQYVYANPGTPYTPDEAVTARREVEKQRAERLGNRRAPEPDRYSPPPAAVFEYGTQRAGSNWREMLLAEKQAVQARGIKQDDAALAAYAHELDL